MPDRQPTRSGDTPENAPLFIFRPPEPVDVENDDSDSSPSTSTLGETAIRSSFTTQSEDGFTTDMHFHSDFVAAKRFFGVSDNDSHKSVEEEVHDDEALAAFEGSSLLARKKDHPSKEELRSIRREHLSQLRVVQRSLEGIDQIAQRQFRRGFNEINFTCGVLNCIFVGYIFGVYPQHFWLVYLIEGSFLIPVRARAFTKHTWLNIAFYLADFVCVTNIIFLLSIVLSIFNRIMESPIVPLGYYKFFSLAAAGISCGPLLSACMILPVVCLLFHDINTMADLFIHIFPPMLMSTFRWNAAEVNESWPGVFVLDDLHHANFFPFDQGTISGNTLRFYFSWFILYSVFMLAVLLGVGNPLPRKNSHSGFLPYTVEQTPRPKYDTQFHSLMRGGLCTIIGPLWNRSKAESLVQMELNQFESRDFLVYMAGHFLFVTITTLIIGFPCLKNKAFHGLILIMVTAVVTLRGAKRYTYYATQMYGRMLRKSFNDLLDARSKY